MSRFKKLCHKYSLFVLSLFIIWSQISLAETNIRDKTSLSIAHDIWRNNFLEAIKKSEEIIKTEPNNPVGHFLLGTIYQTISEECRTDRFKDEITIRLDSAIDLAREKASIEPDNPDWTFICGAAYGYRALHRAFHGNWLGAFGDGFKCSSNLNKTIKLDSTYYDAYLGLGAYHYYRTIKAKDFLWLPFISDMRDEGISEIKIAANGGLLASNNARESLLRIYFNEERYDELLSLADSLAETNPFDPYCLLYHAEGLLGLGRLDEADEKVKMLRMVLKKSPYFDPFGIYEAEFVSARIFFKRGDKEMAKKIIDKIISERAMAKTNPYFGETVDKAESFARQIR
jgi:tetratricopeptide (TPR) repeat protein